MDRVALLLEQYPGPVKLGMSAGRAVYLLAAAVLLFGGAAFYLIRPNENGIVGWLSVILCTAVATGFALTRLRRGFELVLDKDGFGICEAHQWRRFKWAEVENFAVVGDELMLFRKRVGFNRANTVIDETDGQVRRTFNLPESYGLTNEGCVRLMSQWQERALRTGRPGREPA